MNKLDLEQYNLKSTLLGGQAFNFDFDPEEQCFYGFTQKRVIVLKHDGWQTYPDNDNFEFLKKYLRLDIDYPNIIKKIQKDKYIKTAINQFPNLRLLKQDFEQTLLSFILSTNNNIPTIRKLVRALCQRFGKIININGRKIYLFPKTEVIAEAKLEDLLECKLGFRAKFLKGAAKHLLETNLNKKIHKMTEEEARTSLKEIKGVGEKITDCVLVFSLGFDNVTPLDIWAKRALVKFYKLNPKMNYNEMRLWIENYFEGFAGWAGQFLYEYIRHL